MRREQQSVDDKQQAPTGSLETVIAPYAGSGECRSHASNKGGERSEKVLGDPSGEVARLVVLLEEERKKRETAELRLNEAKRELELTNLQIEEAFGRANQAALKAEIANIELNQIFNTSVDAMWVIDREYDVLKVNETFLRILGRNRAQTVGQKCFSVFPGPYCQTPECPLVRLSLHEKFLTFDLEIGQEDNHRKSFLVTATPYNGLDGHLFGVVEAYRDITDRKRAEEALQEANKELQRLAALDGLTHIANRRRFDECLLTEWKRMAREKKSLSLILCDLDCFKLYNDTYGHQLGDDCLRAVARCINLQLKRPSDLAARYGGEEFVALLPDTDADGAVRVADSIRTGVENLHIEHGRSPASPYVTLSLGVTTVLPGPNTSLESLVSTADRALYEAKEKGRNRVILRVGA